MISSLHLKLILLCFVCFTFQMNAATTLISPSVNNGGFESGTAGWTYANDNNSKWYVGTYAKYAGSNGCYTDVNGTAGVGSNSYQAGTARVSHFYRDIAFPAGEPSITLTFRWRANGEGAFNDWDNIKVFLVPTTVTPTAGTEVSATYKIGADWYNLQTTWQLATVTIPAAAAGTTQRLVFSWKNDGATKNDPGGGIDEVTIITDTLTSGSGCISNTSQYPSTAFTPTCNGLAETITSAGYATEYSIVNVVSGQTYIFSTDIPTDYLTIANGGGGAPVYASGTTPVSWTATLTGNVRVYNNTNSLCGTNTSFRYRFVQCGTPPPPPANDDCVNATAFPAIPTDGTCASLTNQSTYAASNSSVTPSGACASNSGNPDDDVWFKFVASASTIILSASWVSGETDVYWQVFSGACGSSMTSIFCSDNNSGGILSGLSIGQTYYVRLYTYSSSVSTVQDICLQTTPANDNCITAKAFPAIPSDGSCASLLNQTTTGTTNSGVTPTGACTSNPGTANDDVWFSFVATASDLRLSASWVSGETDIYFQVFSGACGSPMTALLCTDNNSGGMMSGLVIGQTYYVRMYTYTSGAYYTTQNLCISNPCPGGSPANDQPCNAVNIPLGSIASGDNSCSFNSGEPSGTPSCWDSYTKNTVWFSFTAPAGGSVKVRTAPGTLRETQIAVYSGTCGASMSLIACNDDAPDCGYTTLDISELSLSGLTPGATYYIAVDGNYDSTGTFAITVVDGASSYPATSGQECVVPITVCNSVISVGDPGYQGIGFTCDQTSENDENCTTGERGVVWYKIIIDNPGDLYFNIIPNDYSTALFSGDETDYDFLLWKVSGSGSTTCNLINSNGGANTVACNYDSYGVTGLAPAGNAPSPYSSDYDDAYEPGITVAAGDVYLLAVQNYSNSTSGFTLDLRSTAAGIVNYGTPPSVTWSGGANTTSWTTIANWGGCTIPTCGINAIVSPSSAFQPRVTAAMGTVVVKNLTVDPGATLTLGPNSVIKICESLYNNGTIIADPTSTVLFADDNVNHSLNGTLSGSSSLGNLLITDVAGGTNCTVIANANLELSGSLTTSNANSIFNLNNKNLTIAGNIINAAGGTTFTNTSNSTLTFNGSAAQLYSPNQIAATPVLTLNNVVMDHTGTGVTISATNAPDMILGANGMLTLAQGKIITPNSQEVIINNTANSSVTAGNVNSYVQGNLRRYLAAGATGSFDFPVGHAVPGYELANITFTSAAAASTFSLLARFDPWGGLWTLPGTPGWGPECGVTYNAPYLDNGYWSIDASAATTGNYTTTLHNRGYSNAQNAWSIAKSPSSSPAWALNGICVAATPVTAVQRTAMSGFSKFATIQNSILLPVELLSFSGVKQSEEVLLKWITASEKNSDYFVVEKSPDGISFSVIGNVRAAGNSNGLLYYDFTDDNPSIGENYYRLKLLDKDGAFEYSQIVQIDFHNTRSYVSNVHPNPVNDNLYLDYYALSEGKLQIRLYDYLGRMVIEEYKNVAVGRSVIRTDMSALPKGLYVLKLMTGNAEDVYIQKIIKE